MTEYEAITPEWIARAFDVPLWFVGIGDPPPPRKRTRRERIAARVGDAGWWAGHVVTVLGRRTSRAYSVGGRVTDVGDWLANQVSGRHQ